MNRKGHLAAILQRRVLIYGKSKANCGNCIQGSLRAKKNHQINLNLFLCKDDD